MKLINAKQSYWEKCNKIDKPLANIIKEQQEEKQKHEILNTEGKIIIKSREKNFKNLRAYFVHLYENKFK